MPSENNTPPFVNLDSATYSLPGIDTLTVFGTPASLKALRMVVARAVAAGNVMRDLIALADEGRLQIEQRLQTGKVMTSFKDSRQWAGLLAAMKLGAFPTIPPLTTFRCADGHVYDAGGTYPTECPLCAARELVKGVDSLIRAFRTHGSDSSAAVMQRLRGLGDTLDNYRAAAMRIVDPNLKVDLAPIPDVRPADAGPAN